MSINPPIGSSPTIVGGDGMGAEADQTCVGRPGLGTGMGMYGRRARNKTWDRYIYIYICILSNMGWVWDVDFCLACKICLVRVGDGCWVGDISILASQIGGNLKIRRHGN